MEQKRILLTGSTSFVGKNLFYELQNRGYTDIVCVDTPDALSGLSGRFDVVYHLSTVYRSEDPAAFVHGNVDFTRLLLQQVQFDRIVLSSTVRTGDGSAYGQSKAEAEALVQTQARYAIVRLANEFGKWCPPFLNSVVATFCHQTAHGLPMTVSSPDAPLELVYIDDIVNTLLACAEGENGVVCVSPSYHLTVGELAETIRGFQSNREHADISAIEQPLVRKLYSTYLTYLPEDAFGTPLETHSDQRGSFTELLHFGGRGQVSINVSKPGIVKGNHWHHTKTEKFIVVSGRACIRFRKVGQSEVIQYTVSGEDMRVIDIPPGYTHSITNIGTEDLVTVMWANEVFDPQHPDTYYLEV